MYRVLILKVETGEVRITNSYPDEWCEGLEYYWTEGDNGCDGNREQVFERAAGREREIEHRCSDGRFQIAILEA